MPLAQRGKRENNKEPLKEIICIKGQLVSRTISSTFTLSATLISRNYSRHHLNRPTGVLFTFAPPASQPLDPTPTNYSPAPPVCTYAYIQHRHIGWYVDHHKDSHGAIVMFRQCLCGLGATSVMQQHMLHGGIVPGVQCIGSGEDHEGGGMDRWPPCPAAATRCPWSWGPLGWSWRLCTCPRMCQ